jgi:hypothetical protein
MSGVHRAVALAIALAVACCVLAPGCQQRSAANTALPDWSGAWLGNPMESFADFGFSPTAPDKHTQINPDDDSPVGRLPLTRAYKLELIRKRQTDQSMPGGMPSGTSMAKCIPPGMPAIMHHGSAIEFLFTPGRVTILIEDGEVRRIFTDGRAHPAPELIDDTVVGHSIGHWEGDTLVVDTIGMLPQAELFLDSGLNVTANTHIEERMHRRDTDTMQIDTVVTDPAIFTQPYRYTRLRPRSSQETFESQCMLNNRDTADGIDLSAPELSGTEPATPGAIQ